MNMDTNQSSQTQEVQEPSRKRTGRRVTKILLVMTLVLGLLIAPRVLAHGVFGDAQRGGRGDMQRDFVTQTLMRLPLGTEIAIDLFNEDPAEGATATARFEAEAGVTSESALASELEAPLAEANYVQISVGERTERIVLPALEADDAVHRMRGLPIRLMGFAEGDAVSVAFFATEDASSATQTLEFTQGVDSAAAFQASIETALADAAVVEVTLPAQTQTIDLTQRAHTQRMGQGMGERMRGVAGLGGAMMHGQAPDMRPMGAMDRAGAPEMRRGMSRDMSRGHR